jgi:molecular chaperone GrpE
MSSSPPESPKNPQDDISEERSEIYENQNSDNEQIIADLQQELSEALAASKDWQDKAMRAIAEMENSRRRLEKEKEEFARYAHSALIKDLIPVVDNFTRALELTPVDDMETQEDSHGKALHQGLSMIESEIRNIFQKHNLTLIKPQKGDPFNPQQHEAMSETKDQTLEPGVIAFVVEPGYLLFDRLLKPCRVVVNSRSHQQKVNGQNVDVQS